MLRDYILEFWVVKKFKEGLSDMVIKGRLSRVGSIFNVGFIYNFNLF